MSFVRDDNAGESYAVVGLAIGGDQDVSVGGVRSGMYRDAVTGNEVDVSDGRLSFHVRGNSAGIYVLNGRGKIGPSMASTCAEPVERTQNGSGGAKISLACARAPAGPTNTPVGRSGGAVPAAWSRPSPPSLKRRTARLATFLGDGNRPRRFAPLFGKWNPMSHHSETSRDVQTHETWINTRHSRLFAKIWGENKTGSRVKAPIVLLHDSLGCVEIWRNFPAHLSQATGHAVIAYDRLGFGRSDPHPNQLSLNFVREEAQDGFAPLLKQLGFEDFVALGHSVGGGMAVVLAGAFPAQCRALITVSAQAFVEDRTLEGIDEEKKNFMQPGQIDRLRKYHGDKAEWVLNAWTETWLSPQFAGWNLDEDLPKVRCPVLIIHGENDEYGSQRHPERIGALAAGPATIEILPDCGHIPYREKEEDLIAMIGTFLRQIGSECRDAFS